MLHFSGDRFYTAPFDARQYDVESSADMFECIVHLSDSDDEGFVQAANDLWEHLGSTEREQRLSLLEAFGSRTSDLMGLIHDLEDALSGVDTAIWDACRVDQDETVTDEQYELVLSIDGADADTIIAAGKAAPTMLADHPALLAILDGAAQAQLAANTLRAQLVELLLACEPEDHREYREQMDALLKRLKEHPEY